MNTNEQYRHLSESMVYRICSAVDRALERNNGRHSMLIVSVSHGEVQMREAVMEHVAKKAARVRA